MFLLNSIAEIEREALLINTVSYLNGWQQALKNDNKLIFTAASAAQKAVNYILNYQTNTVTVEEEEKEELLI